jgi:hypothetical protein
LHTRLVCLKMNWMRRWSGTTNGIEKVRGKDARRPRSPASALWPLYVVGLLGMFCRRRTTRRPCSTGDTVLVCTLASRPVIAPMGGDRNGGVDPSHYRTTLSDRYRGPPVFWCNSFVGLHTWRCTPNGKRDMSLCTAMNTLVGGKMRIQIERKMR